MITHYVSCGYLLNLYRPNIYKCYNIYFCDRFVGDPTVDGVTNWFATTVLHLPQIMYYSKETLVICLDAPDVAAICYNILLCLCSVSVIH